MIIHGDAREHLRDIEGGGQAVVITDPVWPNAPAGMFPGVDDPTTLLAEVLALCSFARRLVIVLGCDSDPRFLAAVPPAWPFVRACWLRYVVPSRAGTILKSADVAYVFGDHRTVRPRRVLPGEVDGNSRVRRVDEAGDHPCPRRLEHMLWLVDHFTSPSDLVVDPFAGSGTTLVAAARLGRRFWGCEIDPTYHALAVERLRAEAQGHSLAAARSGQGVLWG